jgi:Arc/MetJ-type ribon-helix-helix transcriptional regulator
MNIEIHKPELERRMREGIQSGRFQDLDELLTKALDALSEKEAALSAPSKQSPELPILHLGAMGALHRRDIYNDVG